MWNWIEALEKLKSTAFATVTVVRCTGSTPREPGAKMIVVHADRIHGTIGGGKLEQLAIQDALKCIQSDRSQLFRYPLGAQAGQCCGGVMEVFIEAVNCGPVLYVFGAGHVGQAVCRVLSGTPFRVVLLDDRDEWLNGREIPHHVQREHLSPLAFLNKTDFNPTCSYCVVMTHSHALDQELIEKLIPFPFAYVGLIGSRSKWIKFKQRLFNKGFSETEMARVTCPIGLGNFGKAPQEVAISFASQILDRYYQSRDGGLTNALTFSSGAIQPNGIAQSLN